MKARMRATGLHRTLITTLSTALIAGSLAVVAGTSAAQAAEPSFDLVVGDRELTVTNATFDMGVGGGGQDSGYIQYSDANDIVWFSQRGLTEGDTSGDIIGTGGDIVGVDPQTMEEVRRITPQALSAPDRYESGVAMAVDDVDNLIWAVVDGEDKVVLYSQETGERVGEISGLGLPEVEDVYYQSRYATIALDLPRHRAYVASPVAGQITVIDTAERAVVDQWSGADLGLPSDFTFAPMAVQVIGDEDSAKVYMTNLSGSRGTLLEVDPMAETARVVATSSQDGYRWARFAINPSTGTIVLPGGYDDRGTDPALIIDPASGTITGGSGWNSIAQTAVDPESNLLLSMEGRGTVFADATTGEIIGYKHLASDDSTPLHTAFASGGGYIWASTGGLLTRVEVTGVAELPVCSGAVAWVTGEPTVGGTVTLKGLGFSNRAGTEGSVIAVKLDDGAVAGPGGDVWTTIYAEPDGSFEQEIQLPNGSTDVANGGSNPAYAPGEHWLRLLTGSLGNDNPPRSLRVDMTVGTLDPDGPTTEPNDPGAPCVWPTDPGEPGEGEAPAVTTQPVNVTVAAGNDAVFTATATGEPAPSVAWELSADGQSWTAVADATSATLTIPAVTPEQSGTQYRAVFTNAEGAATTEPATLTVTQGESVTPLETVVTQEIVGNREFEITTARINDYVDGRGGSNPQFHYSAAQDLLWFANYRRGSSSDGGQAPARSGLFFALDPDTMQIVKEIEPQVLTDPDRVEIGEEFAIDDKNGLLWSVVDFDNKIVLYDLNTGERVGEINDIGIPNTDIVTSNAHARGSIALDPYRDRAYVANPFGAVVVVIDMNSHEVIERLTADYLGISDIDSFVPASVSIYATETESKLYVGNMGDAGGAEYGGLWEFDNVAATVKLATADGNWFNVVVDPSDGRVLGGTANNTRNEATFYDPATGEVSAGDAIVGGPKTLDLENGLFFENSSIGDLSTGVFFGYVKDEYGNRYLADAVESVGDSVFMTDRGSIKRLKYLRTLDQSICSGDVNYWVVGTATPGGTITLKGQGWTNTAGTAGSVIAVKLDDGNYRGADGDVWTVINANDDGTFEHEITLPNGGTDLANGGSTPAYPSGEHTLRLLSGSLSDGDKVRTIGVPITVVTADPDNPIPEPVDPGPPCVLPGSEEPGEQVAPQVTSQPVDVTAEAGTDAVFSAEASGMPVPSVVWESSADGVTWASVAGAVSAALTLSAVTVEQSGTQYRAVFTNAEGTVTSEAATLRVTEPEPGANPPVITAQPEAISVVVGESAELSVVAEGEDLRYQWKRLWGSALLPLFGQTDATLSFASAVAEDAGTYVVDVTNADGSVTSQEVTVTVVSPFTDVAVSHTFIDEIGWLASSGISTGYDNGDGSKSFRPSDAVLREQMAAFLYRLAGSPEVEVPEVSPFTDVPTDHAFYAAIVWLAQEGISTGYTEADGTTTFRPSQPVLREQMSAFLWRLAGTQAGADPAEVELADFSDVPDEHVFAQEIAWLADSGITTGYDDGSFRPSAPVLREQMAAFLFRYNQLDG